MTVQMTRRRRASRETGKSSSSVTVTPRLLVPMEDSSLSPQQHLSSLAVDCTNPSPVLKQRRICVDGTQTTMMSMTMTTVAFRKGCTSRIHSTSETHRSSDRGHYKYRKSFQVGVANAFLRSWLQIWMLLLLLMTNSHVHGQVTDVPAVATPVTGAPTSTPSLLNETVDTLEPVITTIAPTLSPNNATTSSPTISPTTGPTGRPSQKPSLSLQPTISPVPTLFPTVSAKPTPAPSVLPSSSPTVSAEPSPAPSVSPSSMPTVSAEPTLSPSDVPSQSPTSLVESVSRGFYRQDFAMLPKTLFFNVTEAVILEGIFESYTVNFAPIEPSQISGITTTCDITQQSGSTDAQNRSINTVDYICEYKARVLNVTNFPTRYLTYINNNLNVLTDDMKIDGLPVESSLPAIFRQVNSPAPSMSPRPSYAPSVLPTISTSPSREPSWQPSIVPTALVLPTPPPFIFLPTKPPDSAAPIAEADDGLSVGAIAAIVILTGIAALAGLFFYYRSFIKQREQTVLRSENSSAVGGLATAGRSIRNSLRNNRPPGINGSAVGDDADDDESNRNVVISPTDSLLSNKSLISGGDSGLDDESGDELDGTKNLQDEFDQYKDQNLEQLRADVEGNLAGFEGIMSAAVTNALMGDEETNVEMQELLWGCSANPDGTEIEASALFEVTDWLKRNESAGGERKRAFMQEILNKMVTSVRYGVLLAEDASRTIHESAAILGLQLAEELPMTTMIISGMRKTATAEDMRKALQEFGDIDVAAVASGRRGFGIIRFRRRKSVDRALRRYKSGEIVILDVSIQMKVLMPSGTFESR